MPRGFPGNIQYKLVPICFALFVAACTDQPTGYEPADLVFRGGAVYTLDPGRPWASAVAVDHGKIVYVGDESGVAPWISEGTEVIDLGAGMLMPGFHDSHMHPMAAGAGHLLCSLEGLTWPQGVLSEISECVAKLSECEWLRPSGLDSAVLEGLGPGTALLDSVSAGHPVLVVPTLDTDYWLNSEALREAGIDAATPQPASGEIVFDPDTGEPTGVLRGAAVDRAWTMASRFSEEALREGLRKASRLANSLGIISANEAAATPEHWAAYRAAEQAGEMTLRVNASLRWDPKLGMDQLEAMEKMRIAADGSRFRADSIKLFVDGSGEGTASLLKPYVGTEYYGISNFGDRLPAIVSRLDANGFDIHMHAYGDRAVRDGLDAIAAAMQANSPWDRRHQLAHIALIDPADLPRFADLRVTADIQPLWAWLNDERRRECESFGPDRCARFLAFRDLFDSGARVVAGSDWISLSLSPLYGIQVAVTRRPPDASGPAWNPDQRLTLEEMLKAYTIDGAWLYGQEAVTGSIEVGKAADLIVLERNLFEVDPMHLRDVKVMLTLLEGEVVYEFAPD